MSEKRVARGRIFRVENMERTFGSPTTYNFLFVEDTRTETERVVESSGGNTQILPTEYPLLFTDHEITVARNRALRNKEDLLEKDFLTDLTDDLF
jgi:hypothetical protein